jgi:hypothetical protein
VREPATRNDTVLVFDEMITGFRWSEADAQGVYGVTPDPSTFGKALGNGFAVSALAGKRELMERGGLRSPHERVFLLSTTHGAETHALAAAIAVIDTYTEEGITARLHALGDRLAAGVCEVATSAGVAEHVVVRARASNLVFATLDPDGNPSPGLPHPVPAPAHHRRHHRPVLRGQRRPHRHRHRHRPHGRRRRRRLRGVPQGPRQRRPGPVAGRSAGQAGVPSVRLTGTPPQFPANSERNFG